MSNQFSGFGNVGTAPTLRRVGVGGEQRTVADLRVYFDRRVPKGDGFEDQGGFWLTVSVWGPRAETAASILQKGARIYVAGTLRQESWKDRETGDDRSDLRLTADAIAIDPLCLESVVYRKRADSAGGGRQDQREADTADYYVVARPAGGGHPNHPGGNGISDQEIPF